MDKEDEVCVCVYVCVFVYIYTHAFIGRELGHTLGDGEWQTDLACCSPWRRKESDTTG